LSVADGQTSRLGVVGPKETKVGHNVSDSWHSLIAFSLVSALLDYENL